MNKRQRIAEHGERAALACPSMAVAVHAIARSGTTTAQLLDNLRAWRAWEYTQEDMCEMSQVATPQAVGLEQKGHDDG